MLIQEFDQLLAGGLGPLNSPKFQQLLVAEAMCGVSIARDLYLRPIEGVPILFFFSINIQDHGYLYWMALLEARGLGVDGVEVGLVPLLELLLLFLFFLLRSGLLHRGHLLLEKLGLLASFDLLLCIILQLNSLCSELSIGQRLLDLI